MEMLIDKKLLTVELLNIGFNHYFILLLLMITENVPLWDYLDYQILQKYVY